MTTRLVRALSEGALGGCAAGHVLEVPANVAAKWVDGVRAEYVDEKPVERAIARGGETRGARRNRTRGGRKP